MNLTTRLGLKKPVTGDATTAYRTAITDNADALDIAALDYQGLIANRPAASKQGRYYYATDEGVLYRDTGSAWVPFTADPAGPPIGTVVDFGGSSDPNTSWLICDGRLLDIANYPTLSGFIGYSFSGGVSPGAGKFAIPDFRGRVAVGVDGSAGRLTASDALGNNGGEEKHSLTASEMPSHAHTLVYNSTVVINAGSQFTVPMAAAPGFTGSAGGDVPHNNMQPYLVVNKLIRVR